MQAIQCKTLNGTRIFDEISRFAAISGEIGRFAAISGEISRFAAKIFQANY